MFAVMRNPYAPAGCEVAIGLTYKGYRFDYAFPLNGLTAETGQLLELSVDGRSMYLFEGTATGPFDIKYTPASNAVTAVLMTVTPDEDGNFSVLIPYTSSYAEYNQGCLLFGQKNKGGTNALEGSTNTKLTTITHLPDFFSTKTSWYSMFAGCTALKRIEHIPEMSRVTTIGAIFKGCTSLEYVPALTFNRLTSVGSAFQNCYKMTDDCFSEMDLSEVTDMDYCFANCTSITKAPVVNTGNVRTFNNTFSGCSSLTDASTLDFSSATSMQYTFNGCASLVDLPPVLSVNCSNFLACFRGCTKLKTISELETGNGNNFQEMFRECSSLTGIPDIDTSKGTNMSYMFFRCYGLTGLPTLNTSRCTNFSNMLFGCSNLLSVPLFDTSRGTNFSNFMQSCSKVSELPNFDFSNATNISMAFRGSGIIDCPDLSFPKVTSAEMTFYACPKLVTTGNIDLPKATNINGLFQNCSLLETTGYLNFESVSNFTATFSSCAKLKTCSGINVSSGVSEKQSSIAHSMFYRCNNLTYLGSLDGLKMDFSVSLGGLLTHDSLVRILSSISDVTENPKTLILGSTNLAKLSEEEKAVATDKGWTLQ